MGFFSELDIELEPKKEYLRGRRHPIEREMTLEEMLEEQILLGEYDMQKKIKGSEKNETSKRKGKYGLFTRRANFKK